MELSQKQITTNHTNQHEQLQDMCKKFVRTVGHLKVPLLFYKTVAFIGATLCCIIAPHGLAVRLFSVFVVEIFLLGQPLGVSWRKCG